MPATVSSTVSSTLRAFNSNNLKFVSTIISNLQIKKKRHREVKEIALGPGHYFNPNIKPVADYAFNKYLLNK